MNPLRALNRATARRGGKDAPVGPRGSAAYAEPRIRAKPPYCPPDGGSLARFRFANARRDAGVVGQRGKLADGQIDDRRRRRDLRRTLRLSAESGKHATSTERGWGARGRVVRG